MGVLAAALQAATNTDEQDFEHCKAVCRMLDKIGDKWTVLVVGVLCDGPMRFNAMQRAIPGVSHRMLTLTLRGLECDGLVRRTVHPSVPPKVEYALTELGVSLIAPLTALATWVQVNLKAIEDARAAYVASAASE